MGKIVSWWICQVWRGNASENKQMFKQSVTNIAVDIGSWKSCNLWKCVFKQQLPRKAADYKNVHNFFLFSLCFCYCGGFFISQPSFVSLVPLGLPCRSLRCFETAFQWHCFTDYFPCMWQKVFYATVMIDKIVTSLMFWEPYGVYLYVFIWKCVIYNSHLLFHVLRLN